MTELIFEPEAEAELEEAGERYEESVPGLGLEFLLEMRERTLELAEAPLSYPGVWRCRGRPVRSCGWAVSASHRLHDAWRRRSRACVHAPTTPSELLGEPRPAAAVTRALLLGQAAP